ncbi:hypothetical protein CKAH01_12389 [Colletotrichum kahawae]|uniref:Uncharacterized protein n=1 Tax=Colletotrichum kahawae TaxID=34407 RepID=A0AAD9YR94_COLKA|nr:hypothetical protein CKAH01_12389 [Colletotrichum kahawae]
MVVAILSIPVVHRKWTAAQTVGISASTSVCQKRRMEVCLMYEGGGRRRWLFCSLPNYGTRGHHVQHEHRHDSIRQTHGGRSTKSPKPKAPTRQPADCSVVYCAVNVTTTQRYSINQLAAIQSMDGGPSLGLGAPGTLRALVCRVPSRSPNRARQTRPVFPRCRHHPSVLRYCNAVRCRVVMLCRASVGVSVKNVFASVYLGYCLLHLLCSLLFFLETTRLLKVRAGHHISGCRVCTYREPVSVSGRYLP